MFDTITVEDATNIPGSPAWSALLEIAATEGIEVVITDFSPFKFGQHVDGFLLINDRFEVKMVILGCRLPAGKRERVLAYELGHYALKHKGDLFTLPPNERACLEKEAHTYAQQLFARVQQPPPEATLNLR